MTNAGAGGRSQSDFAPIRRSLRRTVIARHVPRLADDFPVHLIGDERWTGPRVDIEVGHRQSRSRHDVSMGFALRRARSAISRGAEIGQRLDGTYWQQSGIARRALPNRCLRRLNVCHLPVRPAQTACGRIGVMDRDDDALRSGRNMRP